MIKQLSTYTLAAVICGFGGSALAHTSIKDTAMEGTSRHASVYTAFTITHGCSAPDAPRNAKRMPVTAFSAVFPNGDDAMVFRVKPDESEVPLADLSKHIQGATKNAIPSLAFGGIQDRNIFKTTKEILGVKDEDGRARVRGVRLMNGKLQSDLVGLVQFRAGRPAFEPKSCAKALHVRVAVANYCTKAKSMDQDNRADIWMGHTTPKFNDADIVSVSRDGMGEGFWPKLTINRDMVANPMPKSCKNGGFDIIIQPSDADIDKNLTMKGYWPAK